MASCEITTGPAKVYLGDVYLGETTRVEPVGEILSGPDAEGFFRVSLGDGSAPVEKVVTSLEDFYLWLDDVLAPQLDAWLAAFADAWRDLEPAIIALADAWGTILLRDLPAPTPVHTTPRHRRLHGGRWSKLRKTKCR